MNLCGGLGGYSEPELKCDGGKRKSEGAALPSLADLMERERSEESK